MFQDTNNNNNLLKPQHIIYLLLGDNSFPLKSKTDFCYNGPHNK